MLLEFIQNRDPGDEEPNICDECGTTLSWYDDGGPESGPGRLYLDCPSCRYEREHPMFTCPTCREERRVQSRGFIGGFDPTVVYHLECGHVLI